MNSTQPSIFSCNLCGKVFYRCKRSLPLYPSLCPVDSGREDTPATYVKLVVHSDSLCSLYAASTLKRHGYYCRTRNGVQPPRARACVSCVSTKTKCDNARPACSRCSAKGLDCRYPERVVRTVDMREVITPLPTYQPVSAIESQADLLPQLFDTSASMFMMPQESFEAEPTFHGPDCNDNIDWQFFLSSQAAVEAGAYPSPLSPATAPTSARPSSPPDWLNSRSVTNFRKPEITRLPTLNMPSIIRHQHRDAGTQRVSQIILQTLKSYPLMMIRQKTPPPFIHPSLLAASAADDMAESLEPWHNCMNLVYMANSKITGSRKLFWRNVKAECERFCQRVCQSTLHGDSVL